MRSNPDSFLRRLAWLTLATALLMVLWRYLPLFGSLTGAENAEPRLVTPRGDLAADEKANIEIFEKSRGSVVFITTQEQVIDFWTRNVFSVPRGSGSGFIWDNAGHVITNYHVIREAAEARVRLADGRDYKAVLVGASPSHDIAVLKIGIAVGIPQPLPIGESRNLKAGQKVFAIGNPFGLDWTLTTGIISALDRSLASENGGTIEHLIQTDAAINPGNSGGPLLDSAGRLIGINTAIYSPSGASAGIGFAVPVDTVNRVVPRLIRNGKYIRPTLDVEFDEEINQRLIDAFNVKGAFVLRVAKGSSAEAAGLRGATVSRDGSVKPGDVIVSVGGKSVDSVGKLRAEFDEYLVGSTIRLGIARDGSRLDISVALQPGV